MKILILSNQVPLPNEQRVMRINTLNEMLSEKGHEVTILTSIFNHYDKQKRNPSVTFPDFHVVLLKECGYKKNISVKRIISQIEFSRNVEKWFREHCSEFDCVFAVVPTYEAVYRVGCICKSKGIPLIIDIEDLWPEAMAVVLGQNWFSKLVLAPMRCLANKTYRLADSFTAVSTSYLQRVLLVNKNTIDDSVVYLGVDSFRFALGKTLYSSFFAKPKDEFWVCYIGTLGASYDLETLFMAIKNLHEKGFTSIKCKILGKGPDKDRLVAFCKKNTINVDFVDFMEYQKMAAFLSKCDLMINPIKKRASQSVINKVGDYFASGKPVLNSCENVEMEQLINHYSVGMNYKPGNYSELACGILSLFSDHEKWRLCCDNSLRLFKDKFDRRISYLRIISQIENIEKRVH